MLKTDGIPMWVTIFALLVCLIGCALGLIAMIGQNLPGMDQAMSISWGGRTLGLGLATGVAVFIKSPIAYIAVFVAGLGRELGDLLGELSKSEPNFGVVVFIGLFMIAGLVGIISANKARNLQVAGSA